MKKFLAILALAGLFSLPSFSQAHSDRISLGIGVLYERSLINVEKVKENNINNGSIIIYIGYNFN